MPAHNLPFSRDEYAARLTKTRKSMSDAGEMDILAFFRGKRFIVETKVWYSQSHYKAAKTQLANYLQASGLETGYMIIFDEQLSSNPLVETKY